MNKACVENIYILICRYRRKVTNLHICGDVVVSDPTIICEHCQLVQDYIWSVHEVAKSSDDNSCAHNL